MQKNVPFISFSFFSRLKRRFSLHLDKQSPPIDEKGRYWGNNATKTINLTPLASLAQLGEQLICNQQVIGSNPVRGSYYL